MTFSPRRGAPRSGANFVLNIKLATATTNMDECRCTTLCMPDHQIPSLATTGYTAFGGVGQRIASSSSSSSDAGTWSDPGSQEEGSRHVRSSSNGQLQEHGSSSSSTARRSSSTTMNKDKRKHDKHMQKASGSHSVNIKNRESDWLRT